MQIDSDRTKQIMDEAEKVFITPNAEQTLLELLELKEKIDKAVSKAKISAEKILESIKNHEQKK